MNKIFTAWRTQQENARRSRVDELIQHVVAQGDVTMMNKARQPCQQSWQRLPTVRSRQDEQMREGFIPSSAPGEE